MTDAAASTIAKGSGVSASIKDTIVGIVPSDVVNPFLKANMLQIISALFMAKIFQIPVNSSTLATLALAVFVLSIGAPGVPGGALVCISLLVPLIGVPAEAISIIMGLYSIVGMMHTCVNVTGDAAVTLITARSEDLVDLKTFNS